MTATDQRATSLSPQDVFLLDQWGRQLWEAFGDNPYLVGSANRGGPYRDVDVRMVVPFDVGPLALRTINVAITLWGRQVTGLPIDFQFQSTDEFHKYDGDPRNPMGPRSRTKWEGQ